MTTNDDHTQQTSQDARAGSTPSGRGLNGGPGSGRLAPPKNDEAAPHEAAPSPLDRRPHLGEGLANRRKFAFGPAPLGDELGWRGIVRQDFKRPDDPTSWAPWNGTAVHAVDSGYGGVELPSVASGRALEDEQIRKAARQSAKAMRGVPYLDHVRRRVEHLRRRAMEIDQDRLKEERSTRHRQEAIGLSVVSEEPQTRRLNDYVVARRRLKEQEDLDLARRLIAAARELEQLGPRARRRRLIEQALHREPECSNREIARQIGVSHHTVAALRRKLPT
jgi:hypothetical protein